MVAPVLHLVGPSSAGKTSTARALQRLHPRPLMLLDAGRVPGRGMGRPQPARRLPGRARRIPVRTVLVPCDREVAERRERDRHPHDGIPLGTARGPHERHVTDFPFDLVVDTTTATPEQTAAALLPLLQQPHREAGRDMP